MLNEARGPHDSFDVERPKEFDLSSSPSFALSSCCEPTEAQPAPPSTVAQFTVTKRSEFARRSGRQRRASQPGAKRARAHRCCCALTT